MSQRSSEPELLFGQSETASLFQRYGRAIFAYVRLHALSYEECQDITLDVFQIAWTYDDLNTIQEPERLKWLRRVTSALFLPFSLQRFHQGADKEEDV